MRGLTSNPTIFQKAIQGSADYDEQFRLLAADEHDIVDDYWAMVLSDIHDACDVFSKVYDNTDGLDGFVSVEVDPRWPTTNRARSPLPATFTSGSNVAT